MYAKTYAVDQRRETELMFYKKNSQKRLYEYQTIQLLYYCAMKEKKLTKKSR